MVRNSLRWFTLLANLCSAFLCIAFLGCSEPLPPGTLDDAPARRPSTVQRDAGTKTTPRSVAPSNEITTVSPTVPSRSLSTAQNTSVSKRVLSMKVVVRGFESSTGECRIAIYTDPKSFNRPDNATWKEVVSIANHQVEWEGTIEIPQETKSLAVAAYHDLNGNQSLDKNSFGIPIERYGFSNQPKRGFGPPKFAEAALSVAGDSMELEIDIR